MARNSINVQIRTMNKKRLWIGFKILGALVFLRVMSAEFASMIAFTGMWNSVRLRVGSGQWEKPMVQWELPDPEPPRD